MINGDGICVDNDHVRAELVGLAWDEKYEINATQGDKIERDSFHVCLSKEVHSVKLGDWGTPVSEIDVPDPSLPHVTMH